VKYLQKGPFSTGANSKAYRDNFDQVFRSPTWASEPSIHDWKWFLPTHRWCTHCNRSELWNDTDGVFVAETEGDGSCSR